MKIVLMGGEKDGLEVLITGRRPDVFYAVPNLDDEKVRKVKGERARAELREKLATLAYSFSTQDQSSKTRIRMYRDPARDRVTSP